MDACNGRDFILQLIEKYKQYPCLWQLMDKDYHDKDKRKRALDDILKLFKTKDPQASRETVQKKLSSIRGSYKKEVRKVQASMAPGSNPENVHVPKLWYYNHLHFLQDQDTPQSSSDVSSILDEMPFEGEESDPMDDHSHSSSPKIGLKHKRAADQVLETIAKRMELPISSGPSEKPKKTHDAYGEHVAEKLRLMPIAMVPYCQKIINDAIFLAEMQSLNICSRIVTDNPIISPATTSRDPVRTASYSVTESNSTSSENSYPDL